MQSSTTYKKDRYPGLRSFDKDQRNLFFGREAETTELFNLVSLEKVVVLFGKSGLGKSSLLNAGLSPLLEESGLKPVRVRFSSGNRISSKDTEQDTNLLVRDFIIAFNGFDNSHDILFDKDKPQLWEHIKSTTFTDKEGRTQTPVFIFDQFEEFFYHPQHHQQEFLRQLSEVVHEQPPRRILEWITGIEASKRTPAELQWYQQPDVKIIFSLRSDKLSLMQSVSPYIKSILRNRYELKPLNRQQAQDAIEQPAVKDMGTGYTPAFTFNKKTLADIVNELGKGSDEIESSQLQMVCNYIEQQVRTEQDRENGIQDIEVNETIIVPERDILDIRNNFYEKQLKLVGDEQDSTLARTVIEDQMVIEGQRASLLEKQLLRELNGKRELLEALQRARLIREENTNRGLTYEVSHDTLIDPIEKSRQRRQEEQEKLQVEQEKERLALEAQKRNEELKENLKRLANEMQLREDAEAQKAEAQKQALEAQKQRKRARFYSLASLVLLLLVVIAGFYFIIRLNEERLKSDELGKELLKGYNDNADKVIYLDSLVQTKNLVDTASLTTGKTQPDAPPEVAYEIINDGKNEEDTADIQFQKLVNNTYRQVKKMNRDTTSSRTNRSIREKVKYIEEKFPKANMQFRQNYLPDKSKLDIKQYPKQ